jgi:hypothetical protein
MLRALVVMTLTLLTGTAFAAADTVVVRGQDGSFQPGIASSWKEEGGSVRFTLAEGADAAAVVQASTERIAGAQIKAESKAVVVTGVPLARLLEQVSTVTIGDDPLAGIVGMQEAPPSPSPSRKPAARFEPPSRGSWRRSSRTSRRSAWKRKCSRLNVELSLPWR